MPQTPDKPNPYPTGDVNQTPVPTPNGLSDRISQMAQSLVEKNSEGANWSARFKRAVGENLLSVQDKAFRNSMYKITGGMAMLMVGYQASETMPSPTGKAIAGVVGLTGFTASIPSYNQTQTRHNELHVS